MPKDNEVDEKVMPDSAAQDAVSWEGRGSIGGTIGNWHKITRDEYDYHIKNPRLTYEVRALVPAATVAELRAKADAAERRVGELEAVLDGRECASCTPNGVYSTDDAGPFDCYACGRKANG